MREVVPGREEEASLFSSPGEEIRNRYRVRAPLTHPTVPVLVCALAGSKYGHLVAGIQEDG